MTASRTLTVGSYDAKTRFSELIEQVESGDEITITRHGRPVARLIPIKKKHTAAERREAIDRIKQLRKGLTLKGLKIADLIREGRR
ncbi:MAG TPA: type II toxin-antitoxin system prevent-host-death family antitoxin [Pirellulales bacterium]